MIATTVILGEIRLRTGSIWPGVVMHTVGGAVVNTLIVDGYLRFTGHGDALFSPSPSSLAFLVVLGIIGALLLRQGRSVSLLASCPPRPTVAPRATGERVAGPAPWAMSLPVPSQANDGLGCHATTPDPLLASSHSRTSATGEGPGVPESPCQEMQMANENGISPQIAIPTSCSGSIRSGSPRLSLTAARPCGTEDPS
jgi:hypothetical protein